MLARIPSKVRLAIVGLAFAAAGVALYRGTVKGPDAPTDPLAAMPKDSFLVATIDLAELRRSPIYETVFGKDGLAGSKSLGDKALPLKSLESACGFDPLSRVDTLALAVPEEGDRGELGLAARVNVTRDELSTCTNALAAQRGGPPTMRELGPFVIATPSDGPAAAPKLAYGRGGMLVVGRGTWFDAMIDAATRVKPSVADAPDHARLRSSLTSHPGFKNPTLLVTALLPRTLRERLKREMDAELEPNEGANAIMAGVLGVSGVGVALEVGGPGGVIDASIELVCDSDEGASAVEKLILKKRLEWSKELMLRMIGLGPLLDSIEVKRSAALSPNAPGTVEPSKRDTRESMVRVTATAGADTLASALERVLKLRPDGGRRGPKHD